MAGEETCYNALRNLVELDGLKDKDLQRIVNAVENIKELADRGDFSFQEKMMQELEKIKMETMNEKIEKKVSVLRHKANIERVTQKTFEDRPLEAVMSILNEVQTTAKGAVNSIHNRRQYMAETNGSRYYQGLMGLGKEALEVMKTGALDREVYIEMDRLQNPTSKLADTGNKMAKEIAKVQVGVNKILKMDIERGVGHKIGDVPSYITKQVHDRNKVRGDGSKEAMNNWIQAILPYLDKDRTFGAKAAADEELMVARLEESWKHIVYGERASEAQKRSLHFLDGEKAYLYNLEFGNKSLYEATMARISDNANIVAQMELLGPDTRRGLERIMQYLEKKYRSSKPDVWQKFKNDQYKIENVMLELEGFTSIPGDSLMASAGRFSRNLNNLTYLANTGMRALTGNTVPLAAEVRSSQGLNAFETVTVAMKALAERFALSISPQGLKNKGARETMEKTGMAMHDFLFGISSQFTEDITPGKSSKALMKFLDMMSRAGIAPESTAAMSREVRTKGVTGALQKPFFKMTGLSYINDVDRATAARLMMNGVHNQIINDFDSLPAQFRANIERAGIDEAAWKILQLSSDRLETNKMEVVSPNKIREVNLQIVEGIMKEHKIGGDPAQFLRDVEIRYGTYLWSAGRIATTTPDVRTAALIKGGYKEDQMLGQIRRLIGQFKSFSLFQSDIMTRLFTANPEDGVRELSDVLRGKGPVGSLAAYAASSALFWYMGEQLIRMGQGREPLAADPKAIGLAFLKSGAFGFVGDMIDAEAGYGKDRNVFAYVAGPTFGRAVGGYRIASQALAGDDVSKEVGSYLVNMIPGQNFFMTKRAMDPLILDPLREIVDPEYAYRKQVKQLQMEMGL